jgi:hypothetical protein
MMEVLRDPVWVSIGTIGTVLALVVAYRALQTQLQRKSLSYHAGIDPLLHFGQRDVNQQIKQQIKVIFAGQEISNLTAYSFEIENDGFAEIKAADFDKPLSVHVSAPDRILSARISDASPSDLPVQLEPKAPADEVRIQPLLLNRGDRFRLTLLVDDRGELRTRKLSARIQGVTEIRYKLPSSARAYFPIYRLLLRQLVVLFLFILASVAGYQIGKRFPQNPPDTGQVKESPKATGKN